MYLLSSNCLPPLHSKHLVLDTPMSWVMVKFTTMTYVTGLALLEQEQKPISLVDITSKPQRQNG